LREQMKLIREELGEDDTVSEAEKFRERLQFLDAPAEVKERIGKEIERFKSISNNNAEGNVARDYISTLLDMPWNRQTKDSDDLKAAFQILEKDHYGLKKVKRGSWSFWLSGISQRKGKVRYSVW